MTSHEPVDPPPAAHEQALAHLHARHAAAIHDVRTSFQYRLGDALVRTLSRQTGLGAAARELKGLAKEAWRHKRQGGEPLPVWPSPPRRATEVATLLDEFSHACLAPEFALSPVMPGDQVQPHFELLLAETAWRGNGAAWTHAFSQPTSASATQLDEVLKSASEAGVITALWNKEDPVNFDVFAATAHKFDWVFTSDSDSLGAYRAMLGHDNVAALTFAAQPALHNPIGSTMAASDRIAFFGAWRGDKYPDRAAQLDYLLAACTRFGNLDIYDRNANSADSSIRFPSRWASHVRGSQPYDEVNQTYRQRAAVLNVNSVLDSPTMVARRVFEVLASRTPVISGPARSLEPLFGDTVLVATDQASADAHVEQVQTDVDFRERLAHRGYRHVHTNHTYDHRVNEIFQTVGIAAAPKPAETVEIVCVSNRPEQFDHAIASIERQQGIDRRVTFVANSSAFDMDHVARRVHQLGGRALQIDDDATLGDCLNEALDQSDSRFFAKFDDDDFYGAHHVHDLLLASRYANAAVLGRRSYFINFESAPDMVYLRHPGHEFTYVEFVSGASFLADRQRVDGIRFEAVRQGTDTRFMHAVRDRGERIFSASRFNYLVRRRTDLSSHTWRDEKDKLVRGMAHIRTADPEAYVSI